jgi:modification methylase
MAGRSNKNSDGTWNRTPTSTSAFGTNGRIAHDSRTYYERAINPGESQPDTGPEQSVPPGHLNTFINRSSEQMSELPDRSVHLMVTSPPYNVGKEYEEDLTLDDYRDLLRKVLAETFRVLVPGGRACVNVANLGRRPYIPLHAYVIADASDTGFQMRGEIIWDKRAGAGTSTAWGSWMSASNPTLRDTHEYIMVFQKPPFKRERPEDRRSTISRDEFLEFTKSVWAFGPQSAKAAGHPAPYPVELPRRLILLYTFEGDVVLDPFMGTGATAIAARSTERNFIGYELSADYIAKANERLAVVTG